MKSIISYKTGEEIRLGDQIRYAGSCGIVTSVIYGADCSSQNQNEAGSDHVIALTFTTDAHPLVFIDQAQGDLEFLGRGYPQKTLRGISTRAKSRNQPTLEDDPGVRYLRLMGLAVTRQNYLRAAGYPGEPDAESEATLPKELQKEPED
jgi:hypothetical protein